MILDFRLSSQSDELKVSDERNIETRASKGGLVTSFIFAKVGFADGAQCSNGQLHGLAWAVLFKLCDNQCWNSWPITIVPTWQPTI